MADRDTLGSGDPPTSARRSGQLDDVGRVGDHPACTQRPECRSAGPVRRLQSDDGYRPAGTTLIGLDLGPDSTGLVPGAPSLVIDQLDRGHGPATPIDGDVHSRIGAHVRDPIGDPTLTSGAADHDEGAVGQWVVRQRRPS
jgi:hypothetical protein